MARSLEFYVYSLVDPRDGKPFYIGKGQGKRMFQHVKDVMRGKTLNKAKTDRIKEIIDSGNQVTTSVLATFQTEEEAYQAEIIWIAKTVGLTNVSLGGGSPVSHKTALRDAKSLLGRIKPYMD